MTRLWICQLGFISEQVNFTFEDTDLLLEPFKKINRLIVELILINRNVPVKCSFFFSFFKPPGLPACLLFTYFICKTIYFILMTVSITVSLEFIKTKTEFRPSLNSLAGVAVCSQPTCIFWKQRLVNILQSENEVVSTRCWGKIFWAPLRGEGEERANLMGPFYFWGSGWSDGVGVGKREMDGNNDSQLFLTSRPWKERKKDMDNEKRASRWNKRQNLCRCSAVLVFIHLSWIKLRLWVWNWILITNAMTFWGTELRGASTEFGKLKFLPSAKGHMWQHDHLAAE